MLTDTFLLIHTTEFHILISISTLKLRKSSYCLEVLLKSIILEYVLITNHEIQILNNNMGKKEFKYLSNLQQIKNFTKNSSLARKPINQKGLAVGLACMTVSNEHYRMLCIYVTGILSTLHPLMI